MLNYYKTELGIEAIQQRSRDLNARQRRLLVVIGTEAFDLLSDSHKERLAPPELLEQLQDMGLIVPATVDEMANPDEANVSVSEIQVSNSTLEQNSSPTTNAANNNQPIQTSLGHAADEQDELTLEALSFEEIKQLMAQLLSQYCGLMAKQLSLKIQSAEDLRSLKLCQMQWITCLQESRISPQQLNLALQQINFSLQQLQRS